MELQRTAHSLSQSVECEFRIFIPAEFRFCIQEFGEGCCDFGNSRNILTHPVGETEEALQLFPCGGCRGVLDLLEVVLLEFVALRPDDVS